MNGQKRILDDIAKVAGGALSALGGLKQEIETFVNQAVEKFFYDKNLVTREEFEVLKEMIVKARSEQEEILSKFDIINKKIEEIVLRQELKNKSEIGTKNVKKNIKSKPKKTVAKDT